MAGGFQSYSTTPGTNTSINGINIAEGCPPSGVNDALRQLAADGTSLWQTTPTWMGTTTGSSNAYVLTPSVALTAYTTGQGFRALTNFANSGSATLNISSLGAKSIVRYDNSALQANDIPSGALIDVVYDGTSFRLVSVVTAAMTKSQGVLFGCTLSNNSGTPNTKVDIAAGYAAADASPYPIMTLSGTATVDLGTNGAVNALDTGTIAASTTYHIFLISNGSTVGGLASTSASSPTMPSGYTLKRRIGSVVTDGSVHVRAFVQNGDDFVYSAPVSDMGGVSNPGSSGILRTLTVPTGIKVLAILGSIVDTTVVDRLYYSSPDVTDVAASATNAQFGWGFASSGTMSGEVRVYTNTSAQIRARFTTGTPTTHYLNTHGWTDTRGRLA